jgi:hypothetical protein
MLNKIFFMENLLDLDRKNRTNWMNVLWLESVVNPISGAVDNGIPFFP